jgi:1-phosphofructokinase family hexose kinase
MKSLVLSVSPNTSTDRVSVVENFIPGDPSRTILSFDQAGGSGAHATGVVQQLGGEACSLVVLGGHTRERWIAAAQQQQMNYDYVEISAPNRSSFVLLDTKQGNIAEVIDPGPEVDEDCARRLLEHIEPFLDRTAILILSGSLPPGIPDDFYAKSLRLAQRFGVKTLVDAHSEPMKQALVERPWAIKPNLPEFQQIVGRTTPTLDEQIEALSQVAGVQADIVLLSLGKNGLLVGTAEQIWHLTIPNHGVSLPNTSAVNTIGCGDALVGGFSYAYARTQDVLESARWGIAASTATLGTYGVPDCPPTLVKELVNKVLVTTAIPLLNK